MLAEVELDQAAVCAFGMTRRRDTEAAEDEALALLAPASPRSSPWSARPGGCTWRR